MKDGKKITAIVLAGGKGTRMGTAVSKQYLKLGKYPILYYSLRAFEESVVDEIVLVTALEDMEYCKKEIVEAYSFQKIVAIVSGGKERYHSVYEGLKAIGDTDIVMIHDGARPFVSGQTIERTALSSIQHKACVVGVKVKDTIKISNISDEIVGTPDRNLLWQVQTPQSFVFKDIKAAYAKVLEDKVANITDDAMIWEYCYDEPVKLLEGDYFNIKITTPEDMIFGTAILNEIEKKRQF